MSGNGGTDTTIDTTDGRVIDRREAEAQLARVVAAKAIIHGGFLELGAALAAVEDSRSFLALGHRTFDDFLASSAVSWGRASAYRLIRVSRTFEVAHARRVPDYTKLDLLARVVAPDDPPEAVAALVEQARGTTRDDLRRAVRREAARRRETPPEDYDLPPRLPGVPPPAPPVPPVELPEDRPTSIEPLLDDFRRVARAMQALGRRRHDVLARAQSHQVLRALDWVGDEALPLALADRLQADLDDALEVHGWMANIIFAWRWSGGAMRDDQPRDQRWLVEAFDDDDAPAATTARLSEGGERAAP